MQNGHSVSDTGSLVEICGSGLILSQQTTCRAGILQTSHQFMERAIFLNTPIQRDALVDTLLKPDLDRVLEMKNTPLGVVTQAEFSRHYFEENTLGNLLTDLLHTTFKDVELVLLNNGGLRANLPVKPLTYGDIFNVIPFDNFLAMIQVKGHLLIKILEIGISRKNGGMSWSGLTFHADHCQIESVHINNQPIDLNRDYRILTSDFLAQGGMSFNTLNLKPEQIEILESMPNLRDQIASNLAAVKSALNPRSSLDSAHPRQVITHICEQ